jgi:voltage-gated potassium channel
MFRQLRFLFLLLLVSGVGTTWVFWIYEHGVNPNIRTIGDSLWWWFVSSTTVGYGDIAPVTAVGRLAGVITIIIGIYCYTNFVAITADSLRGLTHQKQLGTARVLNAQVTILPSRTLLESVLRDRALNLDAYFKPDRPEV